MSTEPTSAEQAIRTKADLVTALLLVALGVAVVYLSWTMPRLEARRIHPSTIPGLVPLILGAALTLCGGFLAWRSARQPARGGWTGLLQLLHTLEARRVGAIMALALIHTLVLVGWLPFWLAAMLFIFAFICVFELGFRSEPVRPLNTLIWAAAIAIVGGGGIYLVFERLFLVRLP